MIDINILTHTSKGIINYWRMVDLVIISFQYIVNITIK